MIEATAGFASVFVRDRELMTADLAETCKAARGPQPSRSVWTQEAGLLRLSAPTAIIVDHHAVARFECRLAAPAATPIWCSRASWLPRLAQRARGSGRRIPGR